MAEEHKVLSQREIDALLQSVGATEAPIDAPARPQRTGRAEYSRYDFTSPARFSREQMRTLRLVFEDFTRQTGSLLSILLRTEVEARFVHLEQTSGQALLAMLENSAGGIVNLIRMAPLPSRALLILEGPLVSILVDRVLGGSGTTRYAREREITDIEVSLMEAVIRHINRGLEAAWSKVVEIKPTYESSSLDIELVQTALGSEIVFAVLLEIHIGEVSGIMTFIMPLTLLQPIAQALRPHLLVMQHQEDSREHTLPLESLHETPVPIAVELGQATLAFGDLLRLRPGDVIRLDRHVDEEMALTVNQKSKFLCRPGVKGRNLAVCITRPVGARPETPPDATQRG